MKLIRTLPLLWLWAECGDAALGAQAGPGRGPTDWSDWEKYRAQVVNPATTIKPEDLARAKENVRRYAWARRYVEGLRRSAEGILKKLSPGYIERMIEFTTPGCVGPCPACRAKGLPWHPNGQWGWSSSRPDQLACRVCKTVFPNDEFPENIVLECRWGRGQKFTFVGGEPFRCFGYRDARPSLSGIIRARKVSYMTGLLHTLATAYALSGEARCARGAKAILLRFAEVFPEYLVRAGYGYGEYAGMDPHVAAERIHNLPEDELVYPPNKPDRKIYAGYWAASRIGTSGMDGWWVVRVAEAYDLTCTAEDDGVPVYSTEERIRIERDVLLESTYLAACDPAINNKSVGNRAGAAVVGMCVGHPGLVRFGLDGFLRTVDGWFLPDGGTSESPAYAMMTMSGIRAFGVAFRSYSDPPGYAAPGGKRATAGIRLDGFDAWRDTRYGDCWQGLIWTLQGDLRFPPSADSYRTTRINPSYAELVAVASPTDEHVALLKELAGKDLSGGALREAVFYREPGLEQQDVPPLRLPDVVFPFLSQGYLRTGKSGRDSLVMLNASDYGGHHHLDSLNLYYWSGGTFDKLSAAVLSASKGGGHELLSDLGYLWDHPDSRQTRRTFAHNLVMIDGKDQRTRGRGGSFHLFTVTPRVKVMEASSNAYGPESPYRRTCVVVDHGESGSYLIDIFRAGGGKKREYVFHGPGNEYEVEGAAFAPAAEVGRRAPFAVRFHLPALGEIFVDDVDIREVAADGKLGPNLAPNPAAARAKDETHPRGGDNVVDPTAPRGGDNVVDPTSPRGWGRYVGNGKAEWGFGAPGRADASCARLKATARGAKGRVNVALLCGDSDGYRGPGAIAGRLGATYRLRFSIRGRAPRVNVGIVTWPHDPTSPSDRVHASVTLDRARSAEATADWRSYEGRFSLPRASLPLADPRRANGGPAWSITWTLEGGYEFRALSPGQADEVVTMGDGWGQRNHRNTDRGATLPYVIRRREGPGGDAFVSVFAGSPAGRRLVESVRLLPIPAAPATAGKLRRLPAAAGTQDGGTEPVEGAAAGPPGTLAIAVTTSEGTDLVVSMLRPERVAIPFDGAEVTTDGRLTAILSTGGKTSWACLVEGSRMTGGGVRLSLPAAVLKGGIAGVGGERGVSYFILEGDLPGREGLVGRTFFAIDDESRRAYPIVAVQEAGGRVRVFTKRDGRGFEARPAERWELPATAVIEVPGRR